MDLKKIVLSYVNTFPEVDFLKEILTNFPEDYYPFPELDNSLKVGVVLFGKDVLLSPMMLNGKCYEGSISFPAGCTNAEALSREGDRGIVIGAKFNYDGRGFILYRTEIKHKNP